MFPQFDLDTLVFAEPRWLWVLAVPALLVLAWMWRWWQYRRDTLRVSRARLTPLPRRYALFGGGIVWLALILATAMLIVALARPQVVTSYIRSGGIDMVVLLDGSASMYVRDLDGTRWQRSVQFLRRFADSMSWTDDRVALTLFAHIAAPQIRLTRDPNTFFFFLDHLDDGSPFRLEDDTTWDTNIELGIYWGMRVLDKDLELQGPSPNAPAFMLLSDGQAWTGEVENSLAEAARRDLPVFVVGVGTTAGGIIPDPKGEAPVRSRLDRQSLTRIAQATGGEYLEIERESDADIATRIVAATRLRSTNSAAEPRMEDVYWRFLTAAAGFLGVGLLFIRDRVDLALQLVGGGVALVSLTALLL